MSPDQFSVLKQQFSGLSYQEGHLSVSDPTILVALMHYLHDTEGLYFDHLASISGLHNAPKEQTIEVIYHLYSIPYQKSISIGVSLNDQEAHLPSICTVWKGADWHERETFDLFGVRFDEHPDLRRILLPSNWEGHPMRKDYEQQETFHGIKVAY
jgi:NADH-quinone oxidoreductase subunit C